MSIKSNEQHLFETEFLFVTLQINAQSILINWMHPFWKKHNNNNNNNNNKKHLF